MGGADKSGMRIKGGHVEKKYEVSMEIAGPAAMFTRPDTGAEVLV